MESRSRTINTIKLLLAPLALLVLGFSWSIASPLGSSADEPFHATSIWCAWGESESCEIAPDASSVNVSEVILKSTCYVGWPAASGAGCLTDFIETNRHNDKLVTTTRVSLDSTYSPVYFKVARAFVGQDVEKSILSIRVFNVVLGSLIFLAALILATPPIRRALALSWGLSIIPVGIFFIASINPSSWLIFSVGTYWAFLATSLSENIGKRTRMFSWVGALVSSLFALGSRTDAVIYLLITSVAVTVFQWRVIQRHLKKSVLLILAAPLVFLGVLGGWIFFNRFPDPNLSWGSNIPSGGLPAPLKTLSEMPSFVFGLFGGQGSFSEVATGYNNLPGIRTSGFTYGLGWMEFDLPAFIGIAGAVCTFAIIFLTLRKISLSRVLTLVILAVSFAAVILLQRASVDFINNQHVQPRYLFPLLLACIGIALITKLRRAPLLSKPQAAIVTTVLIISGAAAWLATATRYAVGPLSLMTDFGQPYEWWWHIGPGRLGWFLITLAVTALWIYSTVWVWGRARRSFENVPD